MNLLEGGSSQEAVNLTALRWSGCKTFTSIQFYRVVH